MIFDHIKLLFFHKMEAYKVLCNIRWLGYHMASGVLENSAWVIFM